MQYSSASFLYLETVRPKPVDEPIKIKWTISDARDKLANMNKVSDVRRWIMGNLYLQERKNAISVAAHGSIG